MTYSITKGVIKSVKYVVVFAVAGLILGLTPEVKELTIGGALVLVLNYLKAGQGIKLP